MKHLSPTQVAALRNGGRSEDGSRESNHLHFVTPWRGAEGALGRPDRWPLVPDFYGQPVGRQQYHGQEVEHVTQPFGNTKG